MLTEQEQEQLVDFENRISDGLDAFWQVAEALLQIRDNRLYRDGYPTFAAYCEGRWHFSARYARYLISAKSIFDILQDEGVENLPIRETQLRPLTNIPAEDLPSIWRSVTEETPFPTAKQVQQLVDKYIVFTSKYDYIDDLMDSNFISEADAKRSVVALDSCEHQVREDLVARRVYDATIITEMNRLYRNVSAVYQEVIASGYIQFDNGSGVEISQASPSDLRRKLDQEREHHLRESMIENGFVTVTLKSGDPLYTVTELRKYLTEADLKALADLLRPPALLAYTPAFEDEIDNYSWDPNGTSVKMRKVYRTM